MCACILSLRLTNSPFLNVANHLSLASIPPTYDELQSSHTDAPAALLARSQYSLCVTTQVLRYFLYSIPSIIIFFYPYPRVGVDGEMWSSSKHWWPSTTCIHKCVCVSACMGRTCVRSPALQSLRLPWRIVPRGLMLTVLRCCCLLANSSQESAVSCSPGSSHDPRL